MDVMRRFGIAVLAAALALAGANSALADPPPWAHARDHANMFVAPRQGVVSGVVVFVDYASSRIVVNTPHGAVPILVTPSTSIFHGRSDTSFAEIARGSRVDVDVSELGGVLVAQIIRIH